MNLANTLESWVASSLSGEDLSSVRGFAFNLMEPASGGFGMELIGASEFSEDDPDWPCEEILEASPRSILIPNEVHDGTWESCLATVIAALERIVGSDSEASKLLSHAVGIGVGFVDGDLVTLHSKE